ncbi:MAG: carboxypeptidase regulatory-like domain-containing protein, partial [Planctomycetaceae bacterium]|nr:carboxypeptidase regulatory-like domain-containing protein [Planctomycetaceae bacterium]
MESRDLLSVSPYAPPDAIDFGIVYHDDYTSDAPGQVEATRGDTFIISWNGGAENTKLTQLIIVLSTGIGDDLCFNTDPNNPQGSNGAAWDFQIAEDSDITSCTFTLSEDGRVVTITFGEDFTADKVLKFTVDVCRRYDDGDVAPVIKGTQFEKAGASISAVFKAENYEDTTVNASFKNEYKIPENLKVPGDDYGFPDDSHRESTAGAVTTGNGQTALTGKISGYVYKDLNNDGIKDNGELGIPNVSLSLWVWNDRLNQYVNTGNTAITNGNGYYEFLNVEAFKRYQIRETQPEGYEQGKNAVGKMDGLKLGKLSEQLVDAINGIWMSANGVGENYNFGEIKSGSISGYVYHDRNNDGYWNLSGGEEALAGIKLTLWVWDADQQQYVQTNHDPVYTDSNGYYEFLNVDPFRMYQIRMTPEEGYIKGTKSVGEIDGQPHGVPGRYTIKEIEMPFGGEGTAYNFALYKNGSISGHVVEDGGDPIPDALVEIFDGDGNKVGETTTDENGYYEFHDLPPGEYVIIEHRSDKYCGGSGSEGTLGGEYNEGENSIHDIIISSGDDGINYNFVAYRRGEISGYVYLDENENGEFDAGERGLAGVTLALWVWDADLLSYMPTTKTAMTDENGYYIFTGLCSGNLYQVREAQPAGYDQGWNSIGTLGGEETEQDVIGDILMPPNGKGENYNFGELTPAIVLVKGSISGHVYLDENTNDRRDANEFGIGNVTIILERWVNGSYVEVRRTTTNSNGYYIFEDVD